MFKGINQYVIPLEDNRWGVCSGGKNLHNPMICFDTQEEATDYARHNAVVQESEVLILTREQVETQGLPTQCCPSEERGEQATIQGLT